MPQINLGTYSVSAKTILDSIKQIQEENPDISLDDIQLLSEKYRDYDNVKTRSYYFEYPSQEYIRLNKEAEIRQKQRHELINKVNSLNIGDSIKPLVIQWASNIEGFKTHYNKLQYQIDGIKNKGPKDPIKAKEILDQKIAKLDKLNQVKEICKYYLQIDLS